MEKKHKTTKPKDRDQSTNPRGETKPVRRRRRQSNARNNPPDIQTPPPPAPPPPPTTIDGPRPSYFTCRHTYEATLLQELQTTCQTHDWSNPILTSPHPGLTCLQNLPHTLTAKRIAALIDPVYALQCLPHCVVIHAPSIKTLAQGVVQALLDEDAVTQRAFRQHPGKLAVHALVPGMFKGQPNPKHQGRVYAVAEEVLAILRKSYPLARRRRQKKKDKSLVSSETIPTKTIITTNDDDDDSSHSDVTGEKWLLQLLLLEPNVIAASLVPCINPFQNHNIPSALWPNWYHPGGLAKVDIPSHSQPMPSSAYRKLLEALHCMRNRPPRAAAATYNYLQIQKNHDNVSGSNVVKKESEPVTPVVDLGASPGGWSAVLHLMGCSVVAVDRSPLALDERIMKQANENSRNQRATVVFVKGDAFAYRPPWITTGTTTTATTTSNSTLQETNRATSPTTTTTTTTTTNTNTAKNAWMVSDIIAYPPRVASLLQQWCGLSWATHMVVTVKFKGKPDFDELEKGMAVARGYGYGVRAKHFFSNKNEVTLMVVLQVQKEEEEEEEREWKGEHDSRDHEDAKAKSVERVEKELIGGPMYHPVLFPE